VWEWCSTKWRRDYKAYADKVEDDLENAARRVVRGGSWLGNRNLVRCAAHSRYDPDLRIYVFGFRVVSPGS